MAGNHDVPELLEQFMEACGTTERWVTVSEIRNYYGLDESASPAISGFLHRISCGSFASFPYRVGRIEKTTIDAGPHPRTIRKYLVTRRPQARAGRPSRPGCPEAGTGAHPVLTDYDAIRLFDRVLEKSSR